MRQLYLTFAFLLLSLAGIAQEATTMDNYYRQPVVEDGKHNIILQNRCGNRLSLLLYDDHTDLEFVYKPNAFRRKEFRARNFSNRDNYTVLFSEFSMPQIQADYITEFDYDPFVTRLRTLRKSQKAPSEAHNLLTFVNIADENAFAIAARAPLLLAFKPHQAFKAEDGLLTEAFTDRGEEIMSFIHFDSFEENRFRILNDGTHVLQLFENEVVLVGGESNRYQVNRLLLKLQNLSLKDLIERNEQILAPRMNKGIVHFKNKDIQKVIDLNHRIVYSGIDEGGACFGALNRIYHLIWVRDGSMTSSLMARAGNPELIKIWTPFLLNNPSITRREDGTKVPEFLQIVGTRWTKSEDDGIFFAVWSLYNYYQCTGQDDLLHDPVFEQLLQAIDRFLNKTWKPESAMIISDTRGETSLRGSPYFGYDAVNGNFEENDHHLEDGKEVKFSASYYNQVNTYNLLLMANILLEQRPDLKTTRTSRYSDIAKRLKQTMTTRFVDDKQGIYYENYFIYANNSTEWIPLGDNPWEYSWAQSLGPFFPSIPLSVKSSKAIHKQWGALNKYGFCPWNTIAHKLYEYGMSSKDFEQMLMPEMEEALMLTERYPMPGALTEYKGQVESWRGLPFSAGSLFFAMSGQMLQSLPMGIAVRASSNVDRIDNFYYRLSKIDARASGQGDLVKSYTFNGQAIDHTLQIPTRYLLPGSNKLELTRCEAYEDFRLYRSSCELIDVEVEDKTVRYVMRSPVDVQMVFENFPQAQSVTIKNQQNGTVSFQTEAIAKTNKTVLECPVTGSFEVIVILK